MAGNANAVETAIKNLLYINEKQECDRAIDTFRKISLLFEEIGE